MSRHESSEFMQRRRDAVKRAARNGAAPPAGTGIVRADAQGNIVQAGKLDANQVLQVAVQLSLQVTKMPDFAECRVEQLRSIEADEKESGKPRAFGQQTALDLLAALSAFQASARVTVQANVEQGQRAKEAARRAAAGLPPLDGPDDGGGEATTGAGDRRPMDGGDGGGGSAGGGG